MPYPMLVSFLQVRFHFSGGGRCFVCLFVCLFVFCCCFFFLFVFCVFFLVCFLFVCLFFAQEGLLVPARPGTEPGLSFF